MPRLRSVVVDCSRDVPELRAFLRQFWEDLKLRNEMNLEVKVVSMEPITFELKGEALRGVDFVFQYGKNAWWREYSRRPRAEAAGS